MKHPSRTSSLPRTILLFGFFLCAALTLLAGCSTAAPATGADETGECAREENWTISGLVSAAGAGEDACEKFNRPMDTFNFWLMKYFIRPVGYVYGSIVPKEGIKRINMAADNLAFPQRMVSCLLQAKWEGAGCELSRFLINTTIGVAGLFDPADHFWQIYRRDEDIGAAFAQWGIPSGAIVHLPVLQNGYVRDHIGFIFDMALDIKTYLPYTSTPTGFSRIVEQYRPYIRLAEGSYDRYEMFKEYHVVKRRMQLNEWTLNFRREMFEKMTELQEEARDAAEKGEPPPELEKSPDPYVQSLQFLAAAPKGDEDSLWTHLSLWNDDFSSRVEERELASGKEDVPALRYGFIPPHKKADGEKNRNAPLAVLIPGLGGYHFSGAMLMLAELISENTECGVLLLNSSLNWSTLEYNDEVKFGGYGPADAAVMKKALQQILSELEKEEYRPSGMVIAGYSLGALSALDLAADPEVKADGAIAVNPPVDLIYAMDRLDDCRRAVEKLPESEIVPLAVDAFAKSMAVSADPHKLADLVEFSPLQAKLMIFLSFGYSLRDMLAVPAERDGKLDRVELPYSSCRRTPYYREIDRYSFRDYMEQFVAPEYPALTAKELNDRTSLRRMEAFLKHSDKIRIFHNRNDFLLSDDDRAFLDRTLGNKIFWSSTGGHLGNMRTDEFRERFLAEFKSRLPEAPEEEKEVKAPEDAKDAKETENASEPEKKTAPAASASAAPVKAGPESR